MRAAAVALLASLLAGCGGPASPPSPAPARRDLRVLMGADIADLDPHTAFDDVSAVILINVYDTLVRFDRNLQLGPGLAVRWINPDDRTWRFHLDPAARFPDGSALSASDVKFSLDRLRSLSGSQLTGFIRHVSEVAIVDRLTVDMRTDTPVAILNGLALVPILSERFTREAEAKRGTTPLADQAFGTGPFRLSRFERGKVAILEANPHSARPSSLQRVEITLRQGWQSQDLDTLRPDLALFPRRADVAEIQRALGPDRSLVAFDTLAVFYASLNVRPTIAGRPGPNPLRDPRLRQALALAVDREALTSGRVQGLRAAGQLVVPQVFGFDPGVPAPRFDPDTARRLVREAGVQGVSLAFEAPIGGSHVIEERIVQQWRAIGVEARIREQPPAEYAEALRTGRFEVTYEGYGCGSADASELLTYALHSADPAHGYGPGNSAGYQNPEVDRIAEENLAVFDPRKRLALLQQALRIVAEDRVYIPLASVQDNHVVARGLQIPPNPSGELRFDEISWGPPP